VTRGRFITFEGGEGAGKSTQVKRLAARLSERGFDVVTTREPGGSPGAESIRELVLKGAADRWSPATEALLMYAARNDHIERLIEPALAGGAWVVCDRFADSTRAYQGSDPATSRLVSMLEQIIVFRHNPDLTLVFDLPPDVGLERAHARAGDEMRFESKGLEFHEGLRAAYRKIAEQNRDRCVLIDATASMDAVEAAVWNAVATKFRLHG